SAAPPRSSRRAGRSGRCPCSTARRSSRGGSERAGLAERSSRLASRSAPSTEGTGASSARGRIHSRGRRIGTIGGMRGGDSGMSGVREEEGLSQLAARAATGDGAALDAFLEALDSSRTVHRMVGSMLLDQDAVDDVAQEVLISVVGSIGRYRGEGRVTTWLHPIVKRRVTALDESVLPAQRISSMVASRAALRTALARLPEKYRAPLILRDLEQLPVAEVAARLDLPEGTVKAQLSRGRAKLEKILGAL